ncbi:WG repeat-containing protein [Bacteroidia bacterium]|jgi:hypothetical protein|nr:WG repeat-containing protein [Bacteroidia bacterium]
MHNLIYTVSILILSISSLFGQGYDDISDFGVYQNDWALVLKDGLYGFIDTTGTEIIEAVYDDISTFGVYRDDWALVLKDGLYGFIDTDGLEVVSPKNKKLPAKR